MKVIDADALIRATTELYCADCDRRKGIKRGKLTFVYDIGDAPCRACGTGDMIDMIDALKDVIATNAIPVNWLKEHLPVTVYRDMMDDWEREALDG